MEILGYTVQNQRTSQEHCMFTPDFETLDIEKAHNRLETETQVYLSLL